MMKRGIFYLFICFSSRRSCRSSQNRPTSVSVIGRFTSITAMLHTLSWKQTKFILSFLRQYLTIAVWTLIDYEGYSISSKGLLPIVVDIVAIWIKFAHSDPFYFIDFLDARVHSCHLLLGHIQLTLIHGPNIPGFYAILFFTALDFSFTPLCIHYWV